MDQLAIARKAIEDEIGALTAEVERLEAVLSTLDRTTGTPSPKTTPRVPAPTEAPDFHKIKASPSEPAPAKRGRPAGKKSMVDIDGVLGIIKDAGKKGIKALSLASQLKKSGNARPSKVELLETGKVKVSGTDGGTTYTIVA